MVAHRAGTRVRGRLFYERGKLSWREILIGATRKFRDGVPVHFVQVQTNRNPTFRAKIRRHKETVRVFPDETVLLAQARLACEGDHAVTVMIEKIIGKDPFANAKGEVSFAAGFDYDFRKRSADFYESLASRVRCGELVRGERHSPSQALAFAFGFCGSNGIRQRKALFTASESGK